MDNRYPVQRQWPIQVSTRVNSEILMYLGRGGADNLYIHNQAEWAIRHHNPTHLILTWTDPDRFCMRLPGAQDVRTSTPAQVKTQVNQDEANWDYEVSEPSLWSDTWNNVVGTDPPSRHRYPEISESEWQVLTQYYLKFWSTSEQDRLKHILIRDIENQCAEQNIQLVTTNKFLISLLPSTDSDVLCNHLSLQQHDVLTELILAEILA